jgi:hypothetical protein
MERVRLGKTELQVSPIAFGTWSFGGEWGQFDTDEAKATIGRTVEIGITLFDTAQGYEGRETSRAHMHITAARESGEMVGGHLMEGTKAFLIEAISARSADPLPSASTRTTWGSPFGSESGEPSRDRRPVRPRSCDRYGSLADLAKRSVLRPIEPEVLRAGDSSP